MKKKLKTLLLLSLTLGCSSPIIEEGIVVDKEFSPAKSTVVYNVALKGPQVIYKPDCWEIWVANKYGVTKHKVDETTYHRLNIGAYINVNSVK